MTIISYSGYDSFYGAQTGAWVLTVHPSLNRRRDAASVYWEGAGSRLGR
jgi:hypothetical protein